MLKKSFFVLMMMLLIVVLSNAQVPRYINYQGMLTDASDNPITGTRSIQFAIYNTSAGGSALWTETQNVNVSDGIFNVLLGSVTPIDYSVFNGADKYLGIKVGSDAWMDVRKRLVSVGYSYRAYDADKVDGKDASAFVESGQANSITSGMIQDNAVGSSDVANNSLTATDLAVNVVSSVDGVTNDGGNIDLIGSGGITITPDNSNNRITIAGGGGGGIGGSGTTNYIPKFTASTTIGNSVIYQNGSDIGIGITSPADKMHVSGSLRVTSGALRVLNSYIIAGSPSGYNAYDIAAGDDIIATDDVLAGDNIVAGSPSSSYTSDCVVASNDVIADDHVQANNIHATGGSVRAGSPSSSYGAGDVAATDDLIADDDCIVGDHVQANNIHATGGSIRAGSPSSSYGAGDVAATDDLIADDVIVAGNDISTTSGNIITGSPSTWTPNAGDIVATDDVAGDDDIIAGDNVQGSGNVIAVNGKVQTGYPSISHTDGDIVSTDDLWADDDIGCTGTKSAVIETATFGTRRFYCEEATEVYFFDRGQGQLVNGQAIIHLESMFLEAVTIDSKNKMIVQITLTADCNGIFVTNKTGTSFTVKELMQGQSNATFDWEICAKRKNYETTRLETFDSEKNGPRSEIIIN